MSAEAWQESNARYLSASLAWLRLRLEQFAEREYPSAPQVTALVPAPAQAAPPARRQWFGQAPTITNSVAPEAVVLPSIPRAMISDEQVAQAAAEREEAAQSDPPPAPVLLAHNLGLSEFELDTLLLCVALELDTRIAGLCARAQGDPQRTYPTFALALALLEGASWDALSPERPLRYWRLIEINQPAALPLTYSPLRADERIVSYLKGLNTLDDRLFALLAPIDMPIDAAMLAPSQQALVETIVYQWRRASASPSLPVVQLIGADGDGKQLVASYAAAMTGRQLYRLGVESLPVQPAELEALARLWQRESILLPLALYVDAHASENIAVEMPAPLDRLLSREIGVVFLGVREAPARLNRPTFAVDVRKATPAEQRDAWVAALGTRGAPDPEQAAETLAGQFNLNLTEIYRIAQTAGDDAPPEQEQLWDACRAVTRPRLDQLAQRLEPKVTWDDLVVPEETKRLLQQIAEQVRQRGKVYEQWGFARKMNRGLGITVLFAGESGTGKTMAAEVIANGLHLNLYRIDLSAVVNKYIGETEKNLRRLFDAAEDGGAILFFDEADALFGKRSEVKDSHDRYANIEINYLLQRMEGYRGLAILATNMKSALDQAFMRRLRFIVNFAFPSPAERRRIWELAFPPELPKEPLDYERLAKVSLSGGNIHSIALNAAFLAAAGGGKLTMDSVLTATQAELRKLDRPDVRL
jgi:AAA+ superfamily predicted ATPase